MKKEITAFFIFFSLLLLFIGIVSAIDENSLLGKIITGKIVSGKATQQPVNVSVVVSGGGSAPVLGTIENSILVCENNALSYPINATDIDGDNLTFSISPSVTFFVDPAARYNATVMTSKIFSGNLKKSNVGNHSRTISVTDGSFSDSKQTNITVIAVNNQPTMETIGNQSVQAGSNFYKQVMINDTEDGNSSSGNLTFNITFISGNAIFNISNLGVMNFTTNSSHIGSYEIRVCARDLGLSNQHPNISLCGTGAGSNKSVCDSFNLSITAEPVSGQVLSVGGGGATGGAVQCEPKWGCEDWGTCQNTKEALNTGELSGEDYRIASEECNENNWDNIICGYQRRNCIDVKNCNTGKNKPNEAQGCYYTINPSCFDSIKNCHDGRCELLVDCGGPCGVCPTCSDLIQNQGEEGIDCGGPCANECLAFAPPGFDKFEKFFNYLIAFIFAVIAIILIVVLVIKLYNVLILKKGESNRHR
ncbi:hypothetical protein HYV50_00655 [Candidatus Pacearchaeota archaeon]|nr:hypothetical protein [Candidatus Pacearchaeota archaeon]